MALYNLEWNIRQSLDRRANQVINNFRPCIPVLVNNGMEHFQCKFDFRFLVMMVCTNGFSERGISERGTMQIKSYILLHPFKSAVRINWTRTINVKSLLKCSAILTFLDRYLERLKMSSSNWNGRKLWPGFYSTCSKYEILPLKANLYISLPRHDFWYCDIRVFQGDANLCQHC